MKCDPEDLQVGAEVKRVAAMLRVSGSGRGPCGDFANEVRRVGVVGLLTLHPPCLMPRAKVSAERGARIQGVTSWAYHTEG